MTPDVCIEELAACLDEVAEEVLTTAGCDAPPVDSYAVAAAVGLTIARDDHQSTRARRAVLAFAQDAPPEPTILLREDPRPERLHWAVAHEIGEHFSFEVFRRLSIDPRAAAEAAREQTASSMAGRLLIPTKWLRREGGVCEWWLPDLKQSFATASHELIVRRMLEVRPDVIATIFDHGKVTWRKQNERRTPQLTPEESSLQARLFVEGGWQQWETRWGQLNGWAIHEPGWKREILVLECELND